MGKKFSLKEEKICDYLVTSDMKKIWQVELDLLKKFIDVCQKYNLKYFAVGGTVLGAIRHQGFIPWDDDIDVGMFREDYEKLLEVAEKEFTEPYFFQTPYNDSLFRGHAQLRNSMTSAIFPAEIKFNHNQGIFIDIFPFDEYPKKKYQYNIQRIKCMIYSKILGNYYFTNDSLKSRMFHLISVPIVKIVGFKKLYKHYEKICQKYNGKGNNLYTNLSFKYNRINRATPKETMENTILHNFENLQICIPKDYDKYLKAVYGDYHKYVIGTSSHGKIDFNVDIPYKEYLKELRKVGGKNGKKI